MKREREERRSATSNPETELERIGKTNLKILSRDLHLVELPVMELGEVAVALVESLLSRSTIQLLLVLVSPSLKFPDVVSKVDLGHEIVLERFLVQMTREWRSARTLEDREGGRKLNSREDPSNET